MAEEDFLTNVARMIAAELYSSLSPQVSREMFSKSYFALGVGEKATVDQAVFAQVAANYQAVTPENLKKQTVSGQAGFQAPTTKTGG